MQKLLIALLFIFSINTATAQKYSFDLGVRYASQYGGRQENVIGYFNSKNDQYYLALIKRPHSYMAYLYDFPKLQIHQFNLLEITEGDNINFKLEYLKSDKLETKSKQKYSNYVFDFTTVKETDSLKHVKLTVFKNAKRTVPTLTYHLEIMPREDNLFHIFRESALHPFEFFNTLNYPQGGAVVNATGHTLSGTHTNFKLEKLEDVLLEIEVP